MAQPDKITNLSLKQILLFIAITFAAATTLLIILSTSAATETGSTPFSAVSLIEGVNSGILGSGEQRWFRMMPTSPDKAATIEKSLTLRLSPVDETLNQKVSLQLFEEDQIQFFIPDDTSQMTNFGEGRVIADGSNSETSELFWTGSISNGGIYYIYLNNTSNLSLDYSLFTQDVSNDTLEVEPAIIEPPQPVAIPELGTNPDNAITLTADLNQGHLQPQSTSWYAFVYDDFNDGSNFQDLSLSLLFTPDDGNRGQNVNFELFTEQEVQSWSLGNEDGLINFGAGMLVSRGGDFNSGERIWKGTVLKGNTYYLAVTNGADAEVDYWLFDSDKNNPELGLEPASDPAPVYPEGASPQTAIPLSDERNVGGLEPGQEAWYSFSIHDEDNEFFEEMALTMIATPDNGSRVNRITFDIYRADDVIGWSPGNSTQFNNVGAGGIVVRDNNPLTGERFWLGWVVEDDLYYVRIQNGTDIHIDYWLFNGDVYAPELGPDPANN